MSLILARASVFCIAGATNRGYTYNCSKIRNLVELEQCSWPTQGWIRLLLVIGLFIGEGSQSTPMRAVVTSGPRSSHTCVLDRLQEVTMLLECPNRLAMRLDSSSSI